MSGQALFRFYLYPRVVIALAALSACCVLVSAKDLFFPCGVEIEARTQGPVPSSVSNYSYFCVLSWTIRKLLNYSAFYLYCLRQRELLKPKTVVYFEGR